VRAVEPMVGDRRERQIGVRTAVHERRRTERRLGNGAAVEEQAAIAADRHVETRGELHEQVVRVLAIDQRGQCDSPGLPANRPYTLRGYGLELRELIEQRAEASGIRPHLLAHSFGGYVARQALLEGPALPLASVTLLGTGPGAVPRPAADRVRLFLAVSSFLSPVRGNRLLLLDRHRDPAVQTFLRHRIRGNDTRSLRAIARWLLAEPDRVDALARVLRRDSLPCFVLCGAEERTWPVSEQRRMADRLGAPFAAVPHGGHSVNVEQPAEVVARLLDFWDGLGQPDAAHVVDVDVDRVPGAACAPTQAAQGS